MVREFAAGQGSGFRGLAVIGGTLATAAAVVIGAALALVFAATVAVITLMGSTLLGLAGLALRARRTARARGDRSDLIEAQHLGGHQWVAYGWHERN